MFKKMRKTIGGLMAFMLVLLVMGTSAFAADGTPEKTGSISVMPRSVEGDHPVIPGCTFALYRVADISEQDGTIAYRLTDAFAGSGADLGDLNAAGLAQKLAGYAATKSLDGTVQKADSDGIVRYGQVELGLYLLVQTGSGEDSFETDPFLISVPTMSEDGSEWLYDVTAKPKEQRQESTEVSVRKVWNDGKKSDTRPKSISVELYDADTLIDTVTLSADNEWTHTWSGLKESDAYSVKEKEVKGYTASYKQDGYSFTVTNTPAKKLVQTGQLNWPIPVLAVCGLALFAIGWALVFTKRNR